MNASTGMRYVPNSVLLRWCGRAASIVLIVGWVILFAVDLRRSGIPSSETYPQAASLAIVCAGYIVGWRNELVGGALAIVGTVAFFMACVVPMNVLPQPGAIMFAVPGVCYLLARHFERIEKGEVNYDET
jgi:hypothetical protein